jgi:hypothetical protein
MNRPFAIAVLLALVLFAATPSNAIARQTGQPGFCRFSVVLSPPFWAGRGPQERVRVVSQPDSPIAVTSVLFPILLLPRPVALSPRARIEMPYTLSVTNVSSRFVRSVQLYVQMRTSTGLAAAGPKITRALGPGEYLHLRRQDSLGDRLATIDLDDVRILVAVESVEFDECVFRPSQAALVFEK